MSIRAMRPPWNYTHGARRMDRFGMRSAPRGGGWRSSPSARNWIRFCGRIECYSFGRREPGKVIEGLTVKQEIRAISDAIDNRDMEFLAQYGGDGRGRETVHGASKTSRSGACGGVSIDDYSTYRATRFSEPV